MNGLTTPRTHHRTPTHLDHTMTTTGLTFSAGNHSYRLDGQRVPSVTGIISKGLPKPALMYWSAKMVAEWVADHPDLADQMAAAGGRSPFVAFLKQVPWEKRDVAAVKGTDVHDLAEKLAHGGEVDVPEHLTGYVEAAVAFLDDWGFQPILTERPCASRKWRHAGKFDAIGTIADGRTVALDWKTSASGVYGETSLQLAAYVHSEFYVDDDGTEHPMPKVDAGIGVWLTPTGYEVYELNIAEDAYKAFLHVQYVANSADRLKAWKSEALSAPTKTGAAA
jgi:hypothetical protein